MNQLNQVKDDTSDQGLQLINNLIGKIDDFIVAAVVVVGTFMLASAVKKSVVNRLLHRGGNLNNEVIILIERLVQWTIVGIGLVIALSFIGIDLAIALAPLSFGIGFAFKDIISNFIGGVMILSENRFKIGDFIKVGDKIGSIQEMSVRSTVLKSLDGTVFIIPNGELLTSITQNFSSNAQRRVTIEIGVHYETPLDQVLSITKEVVTQHPDVIPNPETVVIATGFGDSAITLEARFWVETSGDWVKTKSEVIQAIQKRYAQAGIIIPFPMRTLTIDRYDGAFQKMLNPSSHA